MSDCLPLTVCHECCTLLNQCNDFYEKTNQAQCNLRHMLIDSKETSHSSLVPDDESNFAEKTEDTSKEEVYVEDLVAGGNEDDEEYSDNSDNNDNTEKEQISQEDVKDDNEDEDSKSAVKKGSPKQNNKKKVKRKSSLNKADEDDFQDPSEVVEKVQTNVRDGKSRMKIPDNYMTG